MAVILTETDSLASCPSSVGACTGLSGPTAVIYGAPGGGTAGTAVHSATLGSSATGAVNYWSSATTDFNNAAWASGNWTARLEVTTANANLTWAQTSICRYSSGCVNQATIGSLTGQTTSLGTTGVKSHVVSGASQVANTTDLAFVGTGITNGAMSSQSFSWKNSQNIDTPVVAGGSSTPITGTDSATVSDSATMAAALANTDTPTATETQSTTLATSSSDNATLADTPTVGVGGSESGTTTEGASLAANIPATDSPAATETQSATVAQSASDTITLSNSGVANATASGSDSVTLSDSAGIAIPVSGSDSGATTDGASVTAQIVGSDTSSLSDTATTAATATSSDSSTATDDATIKAALPGSDSVSLTDAGVTGVTTSTSDTASVSDTAASGVGANGSDSSTSTQGATLAANLTSSDSAASTDTATSSAKLTGTDSVVLSDNASVTTSDIKKTGSDTFALSESASISAFVNGSDVVIFSDAAPSPAPPVPVPPIPVDTTNDGVILAGGRYRSAQPGWWDWWEKVRRKLNQTQGLEPEPDSVTALYDVVGEAEAVASAAVDAELEANEIKELLEIGVF